MIGDVTYTGPEDIVRHRGSIVGGAIVQHPFVGAGPRWLAMVLGWLPLLVGMFALGLIWLLAFRGFAQRSIQTLREHPGQSFGIGTAALLGVPLVIGLVFVVGAFVGGAWLGVLGIAIYGVALALCCPLLEHLVAAAARAGGADRAVAGAGGGSAGRPYHRHLRTGGDLADPGSHAALRARANGKDRAAPIAFAVDVSCAGASCGVGAASPRRASWRFADGAAAA